MAQGMRRRQFIGQGGLAAGGAVAAACAPGSQGAPPANVTTQPASLQLVVNAGNLVEQWAEGFRALAAEQPHIKVEPVVAGGVGWGGYFEKVTAMVAGGTPPDIVRIATEGFRLLAHHGMILALDALIKRDAATPPLKDFVADVNKDAMKLSSYNGKQYALPHSMNVPVIHYNTTLFAAAGIARPADTWTIDDFDRIARQLTRPDQEQWGFRTTAALWGGICPFLGVNGTDLLTDDYKQSQANDPRTVEAVERYQSYGTRLRVAPPAGAAAMDAWNAGKLGMLLNGSNAPAVFERAGMRTYDILPVPRWKTQTHIVGIGSMGLGKGSKQHEPAWHVLKLIGREDMITKFVPGTVPSRRSVRYKLPIPEAGPPKSFRLYADVQDLGLREVASPPEYTELEPLALKYLGAVLNDELSAKAAMDSLHRDLTEVLAKRAPLVG